MENRGVVEQRTEDSMIVFLGCVFAELVLYALAVLLASGATPPWCQGADLCGSDRDMLLFAGLVFGPAFLFGVGRLRLALQPMIARAKDNRTPAERSAANRTALRQPGSDRVQMGRSQ
jgi:hypothetical protein